MDAHRIGGRRARFRHRAGRGLVASIAAVAMAGLLGGCFGTSVVAPPGAGPLRYRDAVFASSRVTRDLQYGSAPDLVGNPVALKLDLHEPTGDTVAQRPALVWVHGGGFSGGDKADEGFWVDPFVLHGYVVVSINYRLLSTGCGGVPISPTCQYAGLAAINDGQAAVRWLRANAATYRIDPARIGVGGFSAGAIVATGVGVLADQPGSSGNPGYSSAVGGFVSVSGGLPDGQGVDAGDAPGYLFSGTNDTTVPYQWSADTAHALDQAGRLAVLCTEPGLGHAPPDATVYVTQSTDFLYWVLDLTHAPR
ncbi:MAG: alpha/beta hydrolase [Acidimicrobiales bacterium]